MTVANADAHMTNEHLIILFPLSTAFFTSSMDERPHKTHRPAQTGEKAAKKVKARGKDKQNSSNEKVQIRCFVN
jgi:hypothetical protein